MTEWISVEDELPKPNARIKVAYIPEGKFYFDGVVWRQEFTPTHGGWIDMPTHWRPEAPEVDDDG